MPADVNPYRPPQTQESGAVAPTPHGPSPTRRRFPMLWAMALLAYGAFTIMLLRSVGHDRQAGLMFTFNCAVLAVGVTAATIDFRWSPAVGVVAAAVQGTIMAVMLSTGIGDLAPVLFYNLGIAAGFLVLAGIYRVLERRRRRLIP